MVRIQNREGTDEHAARLREYALRLYAEDHKGTIDFESGRIFIPPSNGHTKYDVLEIDKLVETPEFKRYTELNGPRIESHAGSLTLGDVNPGLFLGALGKSYSKG